ARIDGQVVDGRNLEGHVGHSLLVENFLKPLLRARDGLGLAGSVEGWIEHNQEFERRWTGEMHLEPRYARYDDLVDRVGADEIADAIAVQEGRHTLGAADKVLDRQPARLAGLQRDRNEDVR